MTFSLKSSVNFSFEDGQLEKSGGCGISGESGGQAASADQFLANTYKYRGATIRRGHTINQSNNSSVFTEIGSTPLRKSSIRCFCQSVSNTNSLISIVNPPQTAGHDSLKSSTAAQEQAAKLLPPSAKLCRAKPLDTKQNSTLHPSSICSTDALSSGHPLVRSPIGSHLPRLGDPLMGGNIDSLYFHRTADLLVTANDDDSVRFCGITTAKVVSLSMSPVNDSFMSGSLDHSVRIFQGILHLRGRPTVAYGQQGLVFAVAMEGGAIKLFDSRSYDKGPFDTFLVGGDTAEVCDIKFSNDGRSMLLTTTNNNVYLLDAYNGEKKCGCSMDSSPNAIIEATFTPGGQYVLSGSGDGNIHAWNISNEPPNKIGSWDSYIGVPTCLRWAPRRVMFAAASSSELTFWIPNDSNPIVKTGAPNHVN
ncbi:hypothetical protein RD792_016589 [Penstemon davidsonii]|uniref:Transducin/WD40 repeat-like superfamily protein n=1 Tax=Penstemon davidsonii TaxID=160366 RepID=A0ABR0CMD6_9LAMI|nr:hypothetical protein RD792_016589 [Penstemon davidsonii]